MITSVTKDTDAISYVENGLTKKLSISGSDIVISFPPASMDRIVNMYRRQSDGHLIISYFDTNGDLQTIDIDPSASGAGLYLPLAGGTMTGAINMGGQAIIGGTHTEAILITADTFGGDLAVGTARFFPYDFATAIAWQVYSGNAAQDAWLNRIHMTGAVDEATLTFSSLIIAGMKLAGALNANGQIIRNVNYLQLDEITTPTALADHAQLYTKNTNKFFFQDGAGVEHEMSKLSDLIASNVEVSELGTATYDDVQDYINFFGDRTLLSGGAISDNGDGTATVALGKAWAKETDADTAVGKFFDFSANASVALTDLTTNYVYVDYNAGTPQIVVSTSILTHGFKQDHIHVGTIFRNGTTLHFHQENTIGIGRVNIVDMYHLEKGDAERASGLITTDGGSLALSVTAGVIYEGLSRHATIVDGSTWSTWHYNFTTSLWVEVTGQTTINNTQYNLTSSGTGLATLTSNRYAVHWVYCDIDGENLHIVYGQGDYTAAQSEDAAVPSLLPNLVTNYGVLIAKIIVKKSTTALIIAYPWTSAFISSLATDHGSLAGLTDDDHTQYMLDSADAAAAVAAVEAAGLTFAENKGIILDAVLSADEKWSGITEAGTAGAELTVGDLVYLASTSKWLLAKADAAATSSGKLGIVILYASGDTQATNVLLYGKMRSALFPAAFTVGAPVHIDAGTAGDMVVAAPSGTEGFVVRIIGYGSTAEDLFFCPDNSYIELAAP